MPLRLADAIISFSFTLPLRHYFRFRFRYCRRIHYAAFFITPLRHFRFDSLIIFFHYTPIIFIIFSHVSSLIRHYAITPASSFRHCRFHFHLFRFDAFFFRHIIFFADDCFLRFIFDIIDISDAAITLLPFMPLCRFSLSLLPTLRRH
jgi:hypothetical protein